MKLLFICTHNRCRSIISEAITNHIAEGRITARSAGSQPAGEVHPLSLGYLAEAGIPTENLRSQSWTDYEQWQPDCIITVCDSAAKEQCPLWFGNGLNIHWGIPDPSSLTGSEEETTRAFHQVIASLQSRIQMLLDADFEQMSPKQMLALFEKAGRIFHDE